MTRIALKKGFWNFNRRNSNIGKRIFFTSPDWVGVWSWDLFQNSACSHCVRKTGQTKSSNIFWIKNKVFSSRTMIEISDFASFIKEPVSWSNWAGEKLAVSSSSSTRRGSAKPSHWTTRADEGERRALIGWRPSSSQPTRKSCEEESRVIEAAKTNALFNYKTF